MVLPASVTDSRAHLNQLAISALHAASQFGPPTDFTTLTTNIKWRVIEEKLLDGQTAFERPDIVIQVFRVIIQELESITLELLKIKNSGKILSQVKK